MAYKDDEYPCYCGFMGTTSDYLRQHVIDKHIKKSGGTVAVKIDAKYIEMENKINELTEVIANLTKIILFRTVQD